MNKILTKKYKFMKKNYDKPVMQLEEFVPNNYCADCSDESHSFVTYLFDCGNGLDETDYYILDANGNNATIDGKYYGPRDFAHYNNAYYYEPCFEHHEVTVPKGHDVIAENDDILSGYYLDKMYTRQKEMIPVVLWTNNHTNMHATVILDPHDWQEVKS